VRFEDRFIFFPSREMRATPASVGMAYEDVRFGPRGRLHGWFVPGVGPGTLVWFHGNAGNVSDRVELLALLHRALGMNLFIFDYQGYGLSEGQPSEEGTYQDARAALEYLSGRSGVTADRIVYYGESLGGAIAARLATEHRPERLIVQAAFTSVSDMARVHYPFLPLGPFLRTRYATIELIGHVQAPILIVHGEDDEIVPLDHAHRLYAAAADPKQLVVVKGAMHNDVIAVGGASYQEAVREFCGLASE